MTRSSKPTLAEERSIVSAYGAEPSWTTLTHLAPYEAIAVQSQRRAIVQRGGRNGPRDGRVGQANGIQTREIPTSLVVIPHY